MQEWNHYRKGYVRIRVCTDSPERFLNLCAHHKILIWKLEHKNHAYEMNVTIKGFYQLKKICQKTRTRVRIIGKYGLPFFFYRNKKRKAFFIGIFLSLAILSVLSRHIWNIHVEGNVHNSTQTILGYLEELDVRHGVLKQEVDCAMIAEKLREEFTDMTWVSAKISGSRLILEIKENGNIYEPREKARGAYDLLSDKNGVIVSMVTRRGTPLKRKGDACQKGEVLVSGRLDILNDSKEVVQYEYTEADADIYVQYPLEYYQSFSMNYEKPVYTGEQKKGYLLQAGSYYLNLKRRSPWESFDTITDLKQMKVTENFKLPVFYGISTDYAYEKRTFTYTPGEARQKAEEKLQALLETLQEKGVQISGNHVKIGIQDGVCTAKGTLTVIEKTGQKAPAQILEQPTERNTDLDE